MPGIVPAIETGIKSPDEEGKYTPVKVEYGTPSKSIKQLSKENTPPWEDLIKFSQTYGKYGKITNVIGE